MFGFASVPEQPNVEGADSQFRARLSSRLLTDFEHSEPRTRPHSLRGDGDAPTPAAALFMASAAAANRRNSVEAVPTADDAKPSPMGSPGSRVVAFDPDDRWTEAKLPLDGGSTDAMSTPERAAGAADAQKAEGVRGAAESKA